MADFVMPQLGADMTAGKLLRWRKTVGDRIQRGEIIADVETDKADIEVEVFTTGVIEELLVQPEEIVPVGTIMAIIREEGKAVPVGERPIAVVPPIAPAQPAPPSPVAIISAPSLSSSATSASSRSASRAAP